MQQFFFIIRKSLYWEYSYCWKSLSSYLWQFFSNRFPPLFYLLLPDTVLSMQCHYISEASGHLGFISQKVAVQLDHTKRFTKPKWPYLVRRSYSVLF